MRHINLDEYLKENRRKCRQIQLLLRSESNLRLVRSRPRDSDARRELANITKRRWELWIKSGKLKEIGERKYKIRMEGGKT